nr:hypothetical protein [uncultured Noviherbaspirillum sp.]
MRKPASCSSVLSSAEVRLLMEVGFMSCGAGNIKAAESIFSGLHVLRPDEASSFIGLAMARIEAGAAQDAVAMLRGAAGFPFSKNIEYKVFLSISLIAAGQRNEAERELHKLLSEFRSDCPERKLAAALLACHGLNTRIIQAPRQSKDNTVPVGY